MTIPDMAYGDWEAMAQACDQYVDELRKQSEKRRGRRGRS